MAVVNFDVALLVMGFPFFEIFDGLCKHFPGAEFGIFPFLEMLMAYVGVFWRWNFENLLFFQKILMDHMDGPCDPSDGSRGSQQVVWLDQ